MNSTVEIEVHNPGPRISPLSLQVLLGEAMRLAVRAGITHAPVHTCTISWAQEERVTLTITNGVRAQP